MRTKSSRGVSLATLLNVRGSRRLGAALVAFAWLLACACQRRVAPRDDATSVEPDAATASPPPLVATADDRAAATALDAGADDAALVGAPIHPYVFHPVTDADRVLAALRPRVRVCYLEGLRDDPSMTGMVAMRAVVNPDGTVRSVESDRVFGLSAEVVSCIASLLRAARFAPRRGKDTLEVPVNFKFGYPD